MWDEYTYALQLLLRLGYPLVQLLSLPGRLRVALGLLHRVDHVHVAVAGAQEFGGYRRFAT